MLAGSMRTRPPLHMFDERVAEHLDSDLSDKIGHLLEDSVLYQIKNSTDLEWLLDDYRFSSCQDYRDKIFGLQSLVANSQRIAVDYTIGAHDLLLQVLRSVISHSMYEGPASQAEYLHQFSQKTKRFSALSGLFGDALIQPSEGTRLATMFCWAYSLPILVHDIEDEYDTTGPWINKTWNSWAAFWKAFEMHAATTLQKKLAVELVKLAKIYQKDVAGAEQQLKERYGDVAEHLSGEQMRATLNPEERRDYESCRTMNAKAGRHLLREAAAQLGFRMFGKFLFHPQEWPFKDEMKSEAFVGDPDDWYSPLGWK